MEKKLISDEDIRLCCDRCQIFRNEHSLFAGYLCRKCVAIRNADKVFKEVVLKRISMEKKLIRCHKCRTLEGKRQCIRPIGHPEGDFYPIQLCEECIKYIRRDNGELKTYDELMMNDDATEINIEAK